MASPAPGLPTEHSEKGMAENLSKNHQEPGSDHDVPAEDEAKNYRISFDFQGPGEGLKPYKPGGLCPVVLGDMIYERYKILGKWDLDEYHTSWVARDLTSSKLVQLDIFSAKFSEIAANGDSAKNFRAFLKKIEDSPEIKGCFQDILDEIWIDSVNGRHFCRVREFGAVNAGDWLKLSGDRCFLADECRSLILTLMRGLCELHDQGLAHGEITPFGLVFVSDEANALSDDQLTQMLEDRQGKPVEAIDSSRTSDIHLPRALYPDHRNDEEFMKLNRQPRLKVLPSLPRIGEIKSKNHQSFTWDVDDIVFSFYGPPENFGRSNPRFTTSENVWSAACVIFELVTGLGLFYTGRKRMLGQMQTTLGDIPNHLRREWEIRSEDVYFTLPFWRWIPKSRTLSEAIRERLSTDITPSIPLQEADPVFSNDEHELLVDLLTKMLEYDPSKRITIREALKHPWFSVNSS